jgi:phosphatidylinositol glycan class T
MGPATASGGRRNRCRAEGLVPRRGVRTHRGDHNLIAHSNLHFISPDENWKAVTNSLAGLFCSSLGQINPSITAAPEDIFPDPNVEGKSPVFISFASRRLIRLISIWLSGLSFRHAQLPAENLCTENLTPFLKFLPCKGLSGLSALMKPYVLLAHEWHAMGVDYLDDKGTTKLGLRWEAVVDLTKGKVENSKDLSKFPVFSRPLQCC